jgi:tripartite-type tricarboxylate transporter receptor subunit TctC
MVRTMSFEVKVKLTAAAFQPSAFLARAVVVAALTAFVMIPTARSEEPGMPATIKVIVPFAAGGGSDAVGRAMAKQLGERLGANVVVENRPGAGGMVGAFAVARAPKDGSVLLFDSTSLVTAAATSRKPLFDVTADLQPIAIVAESPMLIGVSSSSGFRSPKDLVAAARANPDTVTYGSPGVGSIGHLGVELLNESANIRLRHIPYTGTAPALVDVAAGRVNLTIGSYSAMASQITAGRVVPIAVTSAQANPSFPKLLSMGSAAPGYKASIWYALFAPAGLPRAVLQRLYREASEAARSSEVLALVKPDGGKQIVGTLQELSERVRQDYTTWKRLAADKHIIAE